MDEIFEPLNVEDGQAKEKRQDGYQRYSFESKCGKNHIGKFIPTQEAILIKLYSLCPHMLIAKIIFGILLMNPLTKFFIRTSSVYQVYSKPQVKSLHKILIYSLLFILFFMIVFFDLSQPNIKFLYFLDICYILLHIYFYSKE